MSGGVDSSVAAALLKRQGFDVFGLTMRLWADPARPPADTETAARRVADALGIPLYVIDVSETFHREIVLFFVNEYGRGVTPNPCVRCNWLIKWGLLLEQARALGAEYLATGHYARVREEDGMLKLLRAVDRSKDQTYVLYVLTQEKLVRALFPLGEYRKSETRSLAQSLGLPVAEREESQDLCFLAGGDYRDFIRRYAPENIRPGPVRRRDGRLVGEHRGLAYYTIGQRKGLGISSPVPLYVLAKDAITNTLIVGAEEELGWRELTAREVNWISGIAPVEPFRAQVKTRYTAKEAWAWVVPNRKGSGVEVRFDAPQRDITPGQAAVFYHGEELLGGGIIEERQKF